MASRTPTTPPTTLPRPVWPFPDLAPRIFAHRNGQWCRAYTVSGTRRYAYFGPIDDPRAALAQWRLRHQAIQDGTDTGSTTAAGIPRNPTLLQLARLWIASMESRTGERSGGGGLSHRTINTHRAAIRAALDILDPDNAADRALPERKRRPSRRADTLTIADFDRLARSIIRRYSPHHVQHIVVAVGAMYRWASKRHICPMPELGDELVRPDKATKRGHRRESARAPYTPAQVRAMLAASDPLLRACIFLFMNTGQGAADIAKLRASTIERRIHDTIPGTPRTGWARLENIRAKTKTDMAAAIWPETMAAIVAARDRTRSRRGFAPHPSLPESPILLLTDERGRPLVHASSSGRSTVDNLGARFRRMMRRLSAPPSPPPPSLSSPSLPVFSPLSALHSPLFPPGSSKSFYDLRHTFAQAAARLGDKPDHETRRLVMGHTGVHDMDEVYIRSHGWEPIERMCAGLRAWLFEADAQLEHRHWPGPHTPPRVIVSGDAWSGVLPMKRHQAPTAWGRCGTRHHSGSATLSP